MLGKPGRVPDTFSTGIRVTMPVTGRGISITCYSGHHRFVLSLRYLVFAEVKPLGKRDIVLILTIGLPAHLRRRATHRVPGGHQIISIATVAFRSTVRLPTTVTVRVVVAVLPPPSCTE